MQGFTKAQAIKVSTHSHPKVAAPIPVVITVYADRFNTQPPEGGCFGS